jgi:hypothetical protein
MPEHWARAPHPQLHLGGVAGFNAREKSRGVARMILQGGEEENGGEAGAPEKGGEGREEEVGKRGCD